MLLTSCGRYYYNIYHKVKTTSFVSFSESSSLFVSDLYKGRLNEHDTIFRLEDKPSEITCYELIERKCLLINFRTNEVIYLTFIPIEKGGANAMNSRIFNNDTFIILNKINTLTYGMINEGGNLEFKLSRYKCTESLKWIKTNQSSDTLEYGNIQHYKVNKGVELRVNNFVFANQTFIKKPGFRIVTLFDKGKPSTYADTLWFNNCKRAYFHKDTPTCSFDTIEYAKFLKARIRGAKTIRRDNCCNCIQ